MKTISLVGLCAQKLLESKNPNVIFEVLNEKYVRIIVKTSECSQQFVISIDEIGKYCTICNEIVTYENIEIHEDSSIHICNRYILFGELECTRCYQLIPANDHMQIAAHNSECLEQLVISTNP